MEPRRLACSAPGRANLIGNPSDQYGGAVLSCSVDLRAWVTLESSEELSLVEAVEKGSDVKRTKPAPAKAGPMSR